MKPEGTVPLPEFRTMSFVTKSYEIFFDSGKVVHFQYTFNSDQPKF